MSAPVKSIVRVTKSASNHCSFKIAVSFDAEAAGVEGSARIYAAVAQLLHALMTDDEAAEFMRKLDAARKKAIK